VAARRFGLVLFVALSGAAPSLAQGLRSDPVERLRLVLPAPCRDPAVRDRAVKDCLFSLRTLNDLRRAWALSEWRDRYPDAAVASSDAANRGILANWFVRAVREELGGGDPVGSRKILELLTATAEESRSRGEPTGLAVPLGPDVADLVRQGPPGLRGPAARTLGRIDPDLAVAIPALSELLQSPDPSLRQAAVEGLAGLVQSATQAVARPAIDGPARGNHLEAAARAAEVLPVVTRGLNDWHPGVRRGAVGAVQTAALALGRMIPAPPPADALDAAEVEWLRKGFTEERARLRPLAEALGGCAPALAFLVREGDVEFRLQVQKALEETAYVRGRWLNDAPGADAPAGAADDPFAEGLRVAVPKLVAALADQDPRVRRSAIDTLDLLGPLGVPAVKPLTRALEDPDRFVRWSAARTLSHLGPLAQDAAAPLARLRSDPDPDVRHAASAALDRINPTPDGGLVFTAGTQAGGVSIGPPRPGASPPR
jgi:HEAT repeat protein